MPSAVTKPDRHRDRQGRAGNPAPADGVLVKLVKNGGDSVTSGEVIATIDTEAKAAAGRPGRKLPQLLPPPLRLPPLPCTASSRQPVRPQDPRREGHRRRRRRRLRPWWPCDQGRRRCCQPKAAAPPLPARLSSWLPVTVRAARSDDPSACPHRRAPDPVEERKRHPDHVQRSEHGPDHGAAQAVRRQVREGPRRASGLHGLS